MSLNLLNGQLDAVYPYKNVNLLKLFRIKVLYQ